MAIAHPSHDRPSRRNLLIGLARLVLAPAALVAIVSLLGWRWRGELEHFGRWFVHRFGVAGMAAGAFLADGLHVPLPPQFYLLTGIAGGIGPVMALASVIVGSVLGGLAVFAFARETSRMSSFEKRIEPTRVYVEQLVRKRGYWGIAAAGLLPISFFLLCVLGGMMRLRYRAYGILALMRIPRLVGSYLLIELAWHHA